MPRVDADLRVLGGVDPRLARRRCADDDRPRPTSARAPRRRASRLPPPGTATGCFDGAHHDRCRRAPTWCMSHVDPHSLVRNQRRATRLERSPRLPRHALAERDAARSFGPRTTGAAGHSPGAAGHFVSVGLPRRARSRSQNRALTCTLHGPPALCRERPESRTSAIPAAHARRRPPEPPVGKVRKRYRVAPQTITVTNCSLS